MSKKLFFMFCFFVMQSHLSLAEVQMQDFQFQSPIETVANTPFVRVVLTPEIYEGVASANADDIRIFNANGEAVPFYYEKDVAQHKEIQADYYVLTDLNGQAVDEYVYKSIKKKNKTIYQREFKKIPTKRKSGLLFDLSEIKDPIHSLKFEWKIDSKSFSHNLEIYYSSDLERWTAQGSHLLSFYSNEIGRLEKNEIVFQKSPPKYLKIILTDKDPEMRERFFSYLKQVQFKVLQEPDSQVAKISIVADPESVYPLQNAKDQTWVFTYDLKSSNPVESVQFEFAEKNFYYSASLKGYTSEGEFKKESVPLFDMRQHLYRYDNEKQSLQFDFDSKQQKVGFFALELTSWGENKQPPEMTATIEPESLIFLTQGQGPYTLAYGYKNLPMVVFDIETTFGEDEILFKEIPTAKLGESKKTRDDLLDYGEFAKKKENYLIYGVMCLGVLVLAIMAYKLFSQMKSES